MEEKDGKSSLGSSSLGNCSSSFLVLTVATLTSSVLRSDETRPGANLRAAVMERELERLRERERDGEGNGNRSEGAVEAHTCSALMNKRKVQTVA